DVRLVGGAHACEGRVEVLHAGQWGTVCDDGWELNNAAVVCRQLGCGSAVSAPGGARFGPGSGPVWLDGVSCEGTEVTLSRCVSEGWSNMNCDHSEDAGVICSAEQGVRLASGIHLCFGRVEVLSEQTWGTVCETDLDWPDAEVICRQESCGRAKEVLGGAYFGEGRGLIRAEVRRCRGDETHLSFCPLSTRGNQSCTHRSDVSVLCTGYTGLRLVGGPDPCSGRVELQWRGEEWAGVCGRHWDLRDASVLCRQLDCGVAVAAAGPGALGVGSGAAWRDHFDCEGSEDRLMACRGFALGQGECPPGARAEVTCSGDSRVRTARGSCIVKPPRVIGSSALLSSGSSFPLRDVRLSAGASRCEGRVEVHHGGTWGRVVQDSWGPGEASVVCRQLGCGAAVDVFGSSQYGTGEGSVCLTGIRCSGGESHLGNCSSPRTQRCRTESSVAVVCSHHRALRLAGGPDGCAGRLEVYHRGSWGTVCDDSWGPARVQMWCQAIKCSSHENTNSSLPKAVQSKKRACLGVSCRRSEKARLGVIGDGWERIRTTPSKERFIKLMSSSDVRLVGSTSPCAGRVEVLHAGQWVTVDGEGWDASASAVVCRQLGCGPAMTAPGGAHSGKGSGKVWPRRASCTGTEAALRDCRLQEVKYFVYNHEADAGVLCSDHLGVRLRGGGGRCSGRVEIQRAETWGTVCDADFDWPDAEVVCRQLDCGIPSEVLGAARFGGGQGRVWAEEFLCQGDEPLLYSCPKAATQSLNCSHDNDVGLVCSGYSDYRLVNGSDSCSGRVELQLRGDWGTVCDRHWGLRDASALCWQLRCGAAVAAPGGASFGAGSGPVWKDHFNCDGSEAHLSKCPVFSLGEGACSHANDAGAVCSGIRCSGGESHLGNCSSPRTQRCRTESSVAVVCSHHRALRLAGGPDGCAGRLEVYHRGSWGTVCDDSWGPADSQVVCRQLQCGTALGDRGPASFGPGTGQIWLDEVGCTGNESSLWECPSAGWGQHDCGHKEDVAVVCSEHKQLRLSGGCSGQVELFYNGSWGSVCFNDMTDLAATVICHQLGCGDGAGIRETASRLTDVPRWLDRVQCEVQDFSLWQCRSSPWDPDHCWSTEVAEVTCSGQRSRELGGAMRQEHCSGLRLVGPSNCSGRVEVRFEGSWGTVCDDSWDLQDAQVVCRQLGCGAAVRAVGDASFGRGHGAIWLDEVKCAGDERHLWDCCRSPLGQSDCAHKEDAGVVCTGLKASMLAFCSPGVAVSTPQAQSTIPMVSFLVLGALLFVVLVLCAGQVYQNRELRRVIAERDLTGSPDAVYEELDYKFGREE
uniref:Si:dkey-21h14.12 n=1 Tax=Lepisosteus oculatus TaxID=7918 RepID=W5MMB3_LEPOC